MRKGLSLNIVPLFLLVAACYLMPSCQKDISDNQIQEQVRLEVHFKPMVDADEFSMGKTYKNAFGEEYSVSAFKFYIHGIEVSNSRTNQVTRLDKNEHYLINATDPSTSFVTLSVPSSGYDGISFLIGVDSIRNVSGAQTGALDPAHGMFWTWSTGYIMAKLEGNSPSAQTPSNVIEYHIGGFRGAESVIRKIHLPFPIGQQLDLSSGTKGAINITANINRWFNHTTAIRISEKPVSMTPGPLATQIADNYATMFTVAEIAHE
jgi:hypothetical protein